MAKGTNESGETVVVDAMNEQNGNGHGQSELMPIDRRNYFITSEQNRKRLTWIIGTCTAVITLVTVYTNVIRDDQTQHLDIKALQTEQAEMKSDMKTNHENTQQQIKEAAKVPTENAKSLQRVETMQTVLLRAVEDLKTRSD